MTAAATSRSSARESILVSIRESLAASAPFNGAPSMQQLNRVEATSSQHSPLTRESLIGDFKTNLELVGGYLHIVKSDGDAADAVRSTIEALGATRIAISNSPFV